MRDHRLDYIRSLAIFFVIMVHAWSLSGIGEQNLAIHHFYHALMTNGVPLFIMLSGALVLGGKEMDMRTFYGKRYARLLIPFLIWSAIIYMLSALAGKYADVHNVTDAVRQYLPRLLENRINQAYWYVPMTAALYLITPLIRPAIVRMSHRERACCLMGGIALWLTGQFAPDIYFTRYVSGLLYYLIYYLFGYWAYRAIRPCRSHWWGSALLWGLGLCGNMLHYHSCFVMIESMALFALLLQLPQRPSILAASVSRSSYAIYLCHFALIGPIYRVLHWNVATAPLWLTAILPMVVTTGVLVICATAFAIARRILPRKLVHVLGLG